MAMILSQNGGALLLGYLQANSSFRSSKAYIYINNYTPTTESTPANFYRASNIPPITSFGTLYSAPVSNGDGTASMSIAELTWTQSMDTTQTAVGYFVVNSDESVLLFAEMFDDPLALKWSGDVVNAFDHIFMIFS